MPELKLEWKSPGPVAERFMMSNAEFPVINGPVGSGKTTTVFMKAIRRAEQQRPTPRRRALIAGHPDGVPIRMFKLCVVRDTYRNLWRSTLPSWWERVPKEVGTWHGGENQPCQHTVNFVTGGTMIEFIADFIAIGDNAIEDVLRGYQPTAFYINEADLVSWEVFQFAVTRLGRYPSTADGGASWAGIFMDSNAPLIGSAFHENVFLRPLAGIELFRQPGGLETGAENTHNLQPGYYERMRQALSPQQYRRMVENLPGFSAAGKAVHEEFNDRVHVAPSDLEPVPGLPLYIGFDAGLDPAAVLGQKLGNGRWHILDELVSDHGTGAIRFARYLNELLRDRYADWQLQPVADDAPEWQRAYDGRYRGRPSKIRGWADPSAAYGADRQEAEQTWIDLVSYHTGIRIEPASTNDTTTRREGLRRVLTLLPDGKPAFVLSPRCIKTRAGLTGGFRFRKLQLGGALTSRWADEVEKNEFSHPCEALEYLMLGGGEGAEIHERRQRGWDVRNLPRQETEEWSPFRGGP